MSARDPFRFINELDAASIERLIALLEAGRRFAQAEGVSDRVVFQLGDAHRLDFGDDQFDVVIGHTLLSHVREPVAVLREMARVVRPEGTVAIFDGDYASLTYAYH